jgi:Tol biopolymer transport system component
MITKAGVKLLDFGLAKYRPSASSSESLLSTREADGTAEGAILGTLQYMSPEQLEAREADARSDIFAFGTVLYEMVTGRKAFTGASQASLIGAILRDQHPAMTSLQPLAPSSLDRIVATCLQKDPEERWQSASDVARELKWVIDDARFAKPGDRIRSGVTASPASTAITARPWWLITAGIALAALAMAAGWMLHRPPSPPPPWTLTRLTMDAGLSGYPTLSPDGKLVAYSSDRAADGRLDLYVKQVAGGQPIPLTTDGAGNTMPDFSPDGAKIVFRSGRDGGGIYEVSAFGGDARLVAPGGLNPKYSPDGSQVAYWVGAPAIAPGVPGSGSVWVARLTGGGPTQVGSHFTSARHPVWSPDGASLLMLGYTSKQAYEQSSIDWWLVPLNGDAAVRTGAHDLLQREGVRTTRLSLLARAAIRAELPPPLCWSRATGTVLFAAVFGDADDLWDVAISTSGMVSGSVTRLTTSGSQEAHATCTPSGNIAFTDLEFRDDVWLVATSPDRGTASDALQRITREPADREHAALSGDAQHVTFASNQSGWLNIWIKNLITGRESIVGSSPVAQRFPILDATGARVAYSSVEPQKRSIHVSTRGGVPEKVCDDCLRATDWSVDGKSLLIFSGSPYEVSTLDLASHRQTLLLEHPAHHLLYGRFSPDERWVSFTERIGETQGRIMVAPIDGPRPVPENTWIKIADVEQDDWANWSPDGQTLYFTSARDGHHCVWGQRVAAGTRRPDGDPFPVLHLHGRVTYTRGGWSSAAGRVAIVLAEETGNIWMMSRPSSDVRSAASGPAPGAAGSR